MSDLSRRRLENQESGMRGSCLQNPDLVNDVVFPVCRQTLKGLTCEASEPLKMIAAKIGITDVVRMLKRTVGMAVMS